MKVKKHGLLALTVVALGALAVAVPVVAGTLAIRGMTGVQNFTPHNVYEPPRGVAEQRQQPPMGRLAFTATVNPYKLSFAFTASRLIPGEDYSLVNPYGTYLGEEDQICVNIVAQGCANKAGVLCLRGCASGKQLLQYEDEPWVSGAQLCLVLTDDLHEFQDPEEGQGYIDERDGVLFSVLGLPIVLIKQPV